MRLLLQSVHRISAALDRDFILRTHGQVPIDLLHEAAQWVPSRLSQWAQGARASHAITVRPALRGALEVDWGVTTALYANLAQAEATHLRCLQTASLWTPCALSKFGKVASSKCPRCGHSRREAELQGHYGAHGSTPLMGSVSEKPMSA